MQGFRGKRGSGIRRANKQESLRAEQPGAHAAQHDQPVSGSYTLSELSGRSDLVWWRSRQTEEQRFVEVQS
jgi:hypothetical protein